MTRRPSRLPRIAGVALVLALMAIGCRDRIAPEDPQILYRRFCAACHGIDGRGDGPAASALDPRPTDLTSLAYNVDELVWRIDGTQTIRAHGDSRMPVWGEVFAHGIEGDDPPERRARVHVRAVAAYVRALERPGSTAAVTP